MVFKKRPNGRQPADYVCPGASAATFPERGFIVGLDLGQSIGMQINDDWQLRADPLQWVLQRRRTGAGGWRDMAFVSSTKDVLARCMKEKGVPSDDARRALDRLPDTFKQWVASRSGLVAGDKTAPPSPGLSEAA